MSILETARIHRRHQQGFTLIELIMVIVLLGILAAVAAPKFADLGSEAEAAAASGVFAAAQSAAAINFAANRAGKTTTLITTGGHSGRGVGWGCPRRLVRFRQHLDPCGKKWGHLHHHHQQRRDHCQQGPTVAQLVRMRRASPPCHCLHPQPMGGFSLLEGVFVLMLLAILLTMATPRWPDAALLEAQAGRLAQDLRYAQALTMQREQPHTLQWTGSNTYRIADANGQPLPVEIPPLQGVQMEPFAISFTLPMGAPAAVYPPLRLSTGESTLTLTVTPLTGTIILQP
ncbi:MAG: prepilin-type N-terminal cleavage/methylation domain-containing protein [Magnetococcus sp. XQGC-1]